MYTCGTMDSQTPTMQRVYATCESGLAIYRRNCTFCHRYLPAEEKLPLRALPCSPCTTLASSQRSRPPAPNPLCRRIAPHYSSPCPASSSAERAGQFARPPPRSPFLATAAKTTAVWLKQLLRPQTTSCPQPMSPNAGPSFETAARLVAMIAQNTGGNDYSIN